MRRILLLALLVFLKIAIIFAHSVHFSFICICEVIADIFQLPVEELTFDSFSTEASRTQAIFNQSDTNPSISTQTEELNQQEDAAGTNVKIYNLNSSQKLIISGISSEKKKCGNCKSAVKESSEKDGSAQTQGDVTINSCMSIETDVLYSKIESGCSSSNSSDGIASTTVATEELDHLEYFENRNCKSSSNGENRGKEFVIFDDFDNAPLNGGKHRFFIPAEYEEYDCSNDHFNQTYVEDSDETVQSQKASSPLKELFRSPQTFCKNTLNENPQSLKTNIQKSATSNSNYHENYTSGEDFKRRFSLPTKLNTTNTSIANFKLVQQSLIEEALQSTQRHDRSLKEIKYPFSSEISLDSKPNDGNDEKEFFSCSSYESLPVSDHLRNAFENNAFLNLCNDKLCSKAEPGFPSVDLVETFDMKSSLPAKGSALSTAGTEAKGCKTLNECSLPGSSADGRNVTEFPKQSNNIKEIPFFKGSVFNFTSEINSNTSMADVYEAIDRFEAVQVRLVSDKFSKLLNETDLSRSGDSEIILADLSRSDDSEMEQDDLSRSGHSETELTDMSGKELSNSCNGDKYLETEILETEINENDTPRNELNKMKYESSSPKFIFSEEQVFEYDNTDTLVNIESNGKKPNYFDFSPSTSCKLYTKTVFIDESPSHDGSPKKQNCISETNSQDQEPSDLLKCDTSANQSHSDQFDEADDFKNPAVVEENNSEVAEQKKLRQAFQQLHETLQSQGLQEASPKISPSCQNESPTIPASSSAISCQTIFSKGRRTPPLRKRTKRNLRSKVHIRNSKVETKKPTCDTVDYQSLSIDEGAPQEDGGRFSEVHEHCLLKENGVPTIDENSSGDSGSDNSVVTVKELNTIECGVDSVLQIKETENEICKKPEH